jgi:uncharacterized DUF497 family protein
MQEPELLFEWDEGNREHIARHRISPREAEEVIHEGVEERLLHLGETARGRILQIVTTWRQGRVRVLSAWDAPQQLKH